MGRKCAEREIAGPDLAGIAERLAATDAILCRLEKTLGEIQAWLVMVNDGEPPGLKMTGRKDEHGN